MRLPLLAVSIFMLQTANASQAEQDYSSVVLVLKLVSATHVKPVTGIVLSDDGLVVVPADFVLANADSTESEIVVLDGGTDIFSHGRPAKIINGSVPGGLAVLSVEGLERPGITLSETDYGVDRQLHLAAFPPAEYIARGSDPLWMPVNVEIGETAANPAVSAQTPLPYVTGAILDECGYLVGLSLTSGAQSLETVKSPVVAFAGELGRFLESATISVRSASCVPEQQPEESMVASSVAGANIEANEPEKPVQQSQPVEAVQDEEVETVLEEPLVKTLPAPTTGPVQSESAYRPSLWLSIPPWLIVSSLLVFILLVWKTLVFIRLHRAMPEQAAARRHSYPVQAASDEPDTTQLQTSSETPVPGPRSGRIDEDKLPDMNDLPDGCDAVVMIEGRLDGDTRFRRFCAINTDHFDIVIGRGDTDIRIEHPAVSRNHVGIEYENGMMTLFDLGSSNGTFIGDVPCLPGEIMFVEVDNEIFLGDVRLNIRLIRKEADLS